MEEKGIFSRKVKCLVRVSLESSELGRISESIYKYLNSLISLYIRKLRGVVLCYKEEISLGAREGAILDGDSRVYFEVYVDLITLSFKEECLSKGIVRSSENGVIKGVSNGVIEFSIKGEGVEREEVVYAIKRVNKFPLFIEGVLK